MKKIKLGICLLIIFILTGCVKYDITNTVGPDKKFTLTIYNGTLNEYYTKESLAESRKQYKELGYKVEDYIGNKYSGLKLIKQYNSIDDISTNKLEEVNLINLLNVNTKEIKLFKKEQKGSISKYEANLVYDLTAESVSTETNEDYSEYAEIMYFGYSIAIPTNAKVISHNATKTDKDNHILIWEITYGTKSHINYVFELDSSKQGEIINKDIEETTIIVDEEEKNENNQINAKNIKKTNPVSTIMSLALIAAFFFGIIYAKNHIKFKRKKKVNDPTILYHDKPPKR